MDKIRISQIAKELSKTSKEVLQKAQELDFKVKTASSGVTATQANDLYRYILSGIKPNEGEQKEEKAKTKTAKSKNADSKKRGKTAKNNSSKSRTQRK